MSSVVNVQNHNLVGFKSIINARVGDLADIGEAERADGSPNKEIATDVSTVSLEPGIEGAGVVVLSNSGEGHGDGAHEASSLADGIG